MKEKINNIFNSIIDELEILVPNTYESNSDGYGILASNDYEAIEQAILGSVKPQDAIWLTSLIEKRVNSYLEIGSFLGISFRIINELFEPKNSFSIDPNIPHRVFKKPRDIFHKINRSINYGFEDAFWCGGGTPTIDSSYFETKFDLIFIDGDHSKESVKRDFFEALKILNAGGTVLLHDVQSWPGVREFAQEIKTSNRFKTTYSFRGVDGFCAVRIV
jgi:predicted O-methyltransferase YrrM